MMVNEKGKHFRSSCHWCRSVVKQIENSQGQGVHMLLCLRIGHESRRLGISPRSSVYHRSVHHCWGDILILEPVLEIQETMDVISPPYSFPGLNILFGSQTGTAMMFAQVQNSRTWTFVTPSSSFVNQRKSESLTQLRRAWTPMILSTPCRAREILSSSWYSFRFSQIQSQLTFRRRYSEKGIRQTLQKSFIPGLLNTSRVRLKTHSWKEWNMRCLDWVCSSLDTSRFNDLKEAQNMPDIATSVWEKIFTQNWRP